MPQALKVPLRNEADDQSLEIETPRELLMLENANAAPDESVPMRIVPTDYQLSVVLDPTLLMSQIAEEARAAAALAVDTAIDVTAVIRGKLGKDEKTIASMLGDKFNPELYQSLEQASYGNHYPEKKQQQQPLLLPSQLGVPHDRANSEAASESEVELNEQGLLLSDTESRVDSAMAEMLLDLGLGPTSEASAAMPTVIEEIAAASLLEQPDMNEWLQLGLTGSTTKGDRAEDDSRHSSDDENDRRTGYHLEIRKMRADTKYAQMREVDMMTAEDEYSIKYENFVENENCQLLLSKFRKLIETNEASVDDKMELQKLASKLKPINVMDILASLKTSWRHLDEIIKETVLRHKKRAELEEELRTASGLERQQKILDHAEDIDEMADFLHTAGLSKTTAKRVAVECVLKLISTPKKLAKIWQRQQISWKDFQIDDDDIEELESALQRLLMSYSQASFQSTSFHVPSAHSFHSIPDFSDAAAGGSSLSVWGATGNSAANLAVPSTPAAAPGASGSFVLDSSYVNETVEDIDDDDDEGEDGIGQSKSGSKLGYKHSVRSSTGSGSTKQYMLTPEGYKSFRGGWIEGQSYEHSSAAPDGEGGEQQPVVYYYNTITGESSWHLPGANDEDPEELVERFDDEGHHAGATGAVVAATSTPAGYDQHHTDQNYYHGDSNYYHSDPNYYHGDANDQNSDPNYYNSNGTYYPTDPQQHYAPNHFAHTLEDVAHYDYDHQQQQQQLEVQHQQQHHLPYYDQYGYYHNEADQQQQQQLTPYYNNGEQQPQYDEHGYPIYDQQYQQSPHDGHSDYYDQQNYDPQNYDQHHYDEYGNPIEAAPEATSEQPSTAVEPFSMAKRRRTLPIPVKAEVKAYSKEEGVSRQLTLLNTQDRWQNALVKCQHFITEQKSKYLQMRVEMFEKVSNRVETRLAAFVEDIKFMQKTLKKELGESVSTERDLRRLFEQQSDQVVQAEKLSFILESLEKFKVTSPELFFDLLPVVMFIYIFMLF